MTNHESALWSAWRRIVERHPAKLALIDAGHGGSAGQSRRWTVRALQLQSETYASALQTFHAGDRIAFRLPNGADWLALFLALQKSALVAVPLDAGLPREGCVETARRLRAHAVFIDGEFYVLEGGLRQKHVCCLKITSGTSGEPKAVACRAEHLLADGRNVCRTMGVRPDDRNLAAIPFGHSYGLGNLVLPLLLQGTAIISAREFLPRQLVEWTRRHRATVFPAVPALLRVLAELPASAGGLAPLRTVISAGAVLPSAVAQAFRVRFELKIHNFYGSSETGGICYDRTGAASLSGRSVGKPLVGVHVSVAAGRIMVESAAVATRSRRWRLPDVGEWNRAGELVLLGRGGQGANIGGKKVHPREVERVIRALPGVTDAVVWLEHRAGRDLLAAAVETKHGRSEIERTLSARLPAWQMPKSVFVAAELPRSARGKLDLMAVKERLGSGAARSTRAS
jgi:acyl-CoA synthetase (AMP-forming)/AMP-acid ligase II